MSASERVSIDHPNMHAQTNTHAPIIHQEDSSSSVEVLKFVVFVCVLMCFFWLCVCCVYVCLVVVCECVCVYVCV